MAAGRKMNIGMNRLGPGHHASIGADHLSQGRRVPLDLRHSAVTLRSADDYPNGTACGVAAAPGARP